MFANSSTSNKNIITEAVATIPDALSVPPEKLQHTLFQTSWNTFSSEARKALPPEHATICNSAANKHAADWLLAVPSTFDLTIPNRLMRIAVSLFLCIPLLPVGAACPSCPNESFDESNTHVLKHNTKGGNCRRHKAITNVLYAFSRQANLPVIQELTGLYTDDNRRPDLLISDIGPRRGDVAIDVSVTTPLLIRGNAPPNLQAAKAREGSKRHKYASPKSPLPFTPFVVETYGGMTPTAIELVKNITTRVRESQPPNFAAPTAKHHAFQAISTALWRENARKVAQYL